MNALQRSLIEKAGNDSGFEHVVASGPNGVTLASARHSTRALVSLDNGAYQLHFQVVTPALLPELQRSFPEASASIDGFSVATGGAISALLLRASSLSRVLPSQAATDYQDAVAEELAALPAGIIGTEMERLVRQRVGQNKFRAALLAYWGSACAVTGVALQEILRASHTKPWSECVSDAERLDVYNGFLLSANLDALFDRFLISFDEEGRIIFAPALAALDLLALGITPEMKLRWVTPLHQTYLAMHRSRLKRFGGELYPDVRARCKF